MSTRRQVLNLYRQMLRESQKFPAYNFRTYAFRKIRDTFRENKSISDFAEIDRQIAVAKTNLDMIRRQVIIGHLYMADKLVLEQSKKTLHPSDD